ncbi:fungal-specific transcription factor domain-containing protein [Lipomyces tetrasporus]|uniref:Fungal-specific transcription factor domain-containing protein n=1 Tax=Lipomyces tetrasporus TaxID=54092 RepID=A0AAD7VW84_9ASCO|nr:fungal-specific transcription factor domain-containing protein [Lipomyces tetrasporus]KAJ8103135.1 fungal-specific transcription factor domain-containing protein [Lipomyces tetrasporus]
MSNVNPPATLLNEPPSSADRQQRQKSPDPQRWPAQVNGKVAIARQRPYMESMASAIVPSGISPGQRNMAGGKSARISHACESCRLRKTKCSGERPVCSHCRAFGIECHYANNKRDRTREELQNLRDKIQQYETIFRQISPSLDQPIKDIVSRVFSVRESFAETTEPTSREEVSRGDGGNREDETEVPGEDLVSAEAGSTGSVDHLDEDINSIGISSPEGYLGKSSDIDWIKKIFEVTNDAEKDDNDFESGFFHPRISDIETASYNLDDLDLAVESVDLSSMPPRFIADKLIDSYFETVHPSFPILLEPLFRYQYDIFCAGYLNEAPTQWLALLNLVFAISSIYGHHIKADFEGHELDHLQYYIRSKILKPDVATPGDVQHVQYIALLSFYLFASSHVNRSYSMLGLAIRNGQGIGLHLRIKGDVLTEPQKEVRVRLWNALYVFERMVCAMTGRPSMISDQLTTAPLPSTNSEADNWEFIPQLMGHMVTKTTVLSGKYFLHESELSKILGQVMDRLYAPGIVNSSWSTVQQIIEELNHTLDKWRENLTDELSVDFHNIDIAGAGEDLSLLRMRIILTLQYYDVRRMVNRPCLCRGDIPNESTQSKEFGRSCAVLCMQAGHRSLSLFPDLSQSPTLHQLTRSLIKVLPWWNVAHYMMSSISAIVLGHLIDYKPDWPNEKDVSSDLDKCLAWFQSFERDSLTSKRCADIILGFKDRVLHRASPSLFESPTPQLPSDSSNQSSESHIQLPSDSSNQSSESHIQQQWAVPAPQRSYTPLFPISQPQGPGTIASPYYYTDKPSPFSMDMYPEYDIPGVQSSSSSSMMEPVSAPMIAPEGMLGTQAPQLSQATHPMPQQVSQRLLQENSLDHLVYRSMSQNSSVLVTTQHTPQPFEAYAEQGLERSINNPGAVIPKHSASQSEQLPLGYTPQHAAEYMIGIVTESDILAQQNQQ